MRRYCLDELPQLFNVLGGQMSIVGPRPIVAAEIERYGANFPIYCSVKPGLTGLWQVSGRHTLSYAERVELDVAYVRSRSLSLDLLDPLENRSCRAVRTERMTERPDVVILYLGL